ncbi:MAG: hypothetical protein DRP66_00130 [Planctomycetota bacterium]|nr:MAG: hypothetical protein DRP66_00130 [Planctomycetota bacterium]
MKKNIRAYESDFADVFKAGDAFSFWKGRVAMYAILKSLGVGEGDEVILPGYTCVMDVTPVKYLGAAPVYVDIEPFTYNMNLDLLADKITERTKVIVAQHTYGYLVDMDRLLEIADRRGVFVIEDCCLALGSKYRGKLAGTFGVASYFSSQWNKPYTTGLGGMALCNTPEIASKINQLRKTEIQGPSLKRVAMLTAQLMVYRAFVYPKTTVFATNTFRWLSDKGLIVGSTTNRELEIPVEPEGFFMAMSSPQAFAGRKQLRKLDRIIQHRKKMTKFYDEMLAQRGWRIIQPPDHTDPVFVRYPVRVKDKDAALKAAEKNGIELGSWFISPLHNQIEKIEMYDYKWGLCPQAEKAAREVVNLPVHPRVNLANARKVIDFICKFEQAK